MQKLDLTGRRFGMLEVVGEHGKGKSGNYKWDCLCDCGKTKVVFSTNLMRGLTKSCGCLSIKMVKERDTVHGMKKHPMYGIWCGIRARCNNPNLEAYKHYGGRGISVSKEWDDFLTFYNDMKGTYRRGLELDRMDNDKGYSKDNCRWATRLEQARNTSRNVFIEYKGIRLIQSEWARLIGVGIHILHAARKRGQSIDDIIMKHNPAILPTLGEMVKKGELWVGLRPSDARPLNP